MTDRSHDDKHSVYVQRIGPGGFFASCTRCGSDVFPDRRTLAEAEADAERHGYLRHIYPREQLEAHESLRSFLQADE